MEQQQQLEDKTIKCADCGSEFTFTAGEQEFFAAKGFQTPRRCKPCREEAKTRRSQY